MVPKAVLSLADMGLGIFAMGVVAGVVFMVIDRLVPKKADKNCPPVSELMAVISENTKAMSKLSSTIDQQSTMLQALSQQVQNHSQLITEMRVQLAQNQGK